VKELLFRNSSFLRQNLLDGMLVERGLVNRSALSDALSHSPSQFKCEPGELISILFLEAWLQSGAGLRRASAA